MGSKTTSRSGKGGGKQNAGKVPTAKGQQREESGSQKQEAVHRTDLSVLRQPINISVQRVCDIVKMYQTCTNELRHLLDNEVEIVYECKVCRNLFRSMANIISHKRVYCKQQYNEAYYSLNKRHTVDDYTVIIQPEPVATSSAENETWNTSDKAPTLEDNSDIAVKEIKTNVPRIVSSSKPKKDLTQIIEELSDKKGLRHFRETIGHYSASNLYEDISKNLISRAQSRKEHAFHLEPTGSSSGVFQTKLQTTTSTTVQAENIDLMKTQVTELQHMVRETEAILDEDGRIIQIKGSHNGPLMPANKEAYSIVSPTNNSADVKNVHVCPQCGSRFSTRKTLGHHMKSLHTSYRLCYPCPCCKSTLTNTWSVYRHLYKVHRKTTAQVRKLRPQIQSKAFKREVSSDKHLGGSVRPGKALPSEQEAARNEQSRIDQENKEWMDNFEDDQELQRCGGCGRRFERRAALTSHSQICQKRIAARKVKAPNTAHVSSDKSLSKNGCADSTKPPTPSKESENKPETVQVTETAQRTRHMSGSNWSDPPKKEVLGKRIEIQIRRDYCKFGSSVPSSSQPYSSNFSRSESPESVTNVSPTLKDETESLLSEVETDTDYSKNRNFDSRIDSDINQISNIKAFESNPSKVFQTDSETSPLTENTEEPYKRSSTPKSVVGPKKRQVSVDEELVSSSAGIITARKRRVTTDCIIEMKENSLETEENFGNVDVKVRTRRSSSEEHYSPVMERKMHSLVNLKRLQCLPCQKKFNKLTNLRRHVAVHIGWNRYRCPYCNYKCFSKYDCVRHINKVHGIDRSEAQEMVQLIESQDLNATEKSPILRSALRKLKVPFRTRIKSKRKLSIDNTENESPSEKNKDDKMLVDPNGFDEQNIQDHLSSQSCTAEDDSVRLFIFDGDAGNKDNGLEDNVTLSLNCLDDAELEDSEVSYLVTDGEPVIHSLENNCNDAVLDFIDENFQSEVPSLNGDVEGEGDHEEQAGTDYSRSDYENDSDIPQNAGSPVSTDSGKTALRRMVMEVIFGSASAGQLEPPTITNGTESNTPSPDHVVALPEDEPTEETVAVQSDTSSQCSNRSGIERRKQPARTRVCVRHDDFIYEGPSGGGTSLSRKAPRPQVQQQPDEELMDRVPKMTLVRIGGSSSSTDTGGVANTSAWRTSVAAVMESNAVASTSRTNFSVPMKKYVRASDKSDAK